MAIPPTAVVWPETMDPSDVLDFRIDCSNLLEVGENITTYTIVPGPESVLLGLVVEQSDLDDDVIGVWLSVSNTTSPAFLNLGVPLPLELTINTSNERRWQRTVVVRVVHK